MQVVILAAGKSSRFFPFADNYHKSLVEIAGKPIIAHTLLSIKKSGINKVIVVVSKDSEIKKSLGDGKDLGIEISYAIQESPLGGGNGLLSAKSLIKDDFFLVSPHRVDFDKYKDPMLSKKDVFENVLLAKKDEGLAKFGFLKVDKDKVLELLEKPKTSEHSGLRVLGIYLLGKNFLDILESTKQEEYQLEAAISSAAKSGKVGFVETKEDAPTLKYSFDLLGLKNYILNSLSSSISKTASIDKTARIEGKVFIDDGAKILEGATIKGSAYIGRNTIVGTGALIRGGVSLEQGSKVGAFTEIKNTLFGPGSSVHSGFVGDSIVGKNCRIGIFVCTSNVRLDKSTIKVDLPGGETADTGFSYFGSIIGDNVSLGVRVTLMPGVVIGSKTLVGPSSIVMKSLPHESLYYSRFSEIVEKKNKV